MTNAQTGATVIGVIGSLAYFFYLHKGWHLDKKDREVQMTGDEIGEQEQPLDVDGIRHLATTQGTEFWLRELCMQIAALRETIQNKCR